MKKFCVIGKDIGYSLSPRIHKLIYGRLDIDAEYSTEDIRELTKEEIERLRADYDGFNVTKPYKKRITEYIDRNLSDFESINTVLKEGKSLTGYNTDYFGFIMDFGNKRRLIKGKNALVYGSGGAAESVIPALQSLGFSVRIESRNEETKSSLEELYGIESETDFIPDVLVNCTPGDPDISNYNPEFVYELKYTGNKLMNYCAQRAIRYSNGLGMLVYQAIAADEIFFALTLDFKQKKDLANEILNELYSDKEAI